MVEPKLKYEQLYNSIPTLLALETPTCLLATTRFLIMGCASGSLFWLDIFGQVTKHQTKRHKRAVTSLSIDGSGEWLASASEDGKCIIQNIYEDENKNNIYHSISMSDFGVAQIVLDPQYAKTKCFLSSYSRDNVLGAPLIKHEKGWFHKRETIMCEDCLAFDWVSGELLVYSSAGKKELSFHLSNGNVAKLTGISASMITCVNAKSVLVRDALDQSIKVIQVDLEKNDILSVSTVIKEPGTLTCPMLTCQVDFPLSFACLTSEPDRKRHPELYIYRGTENEYIDEIPLLEGLARISPVKLIPYDDRDNKLFEPWMFYIWSDKSIILAKPFLWQDKVLWRMGEGRYREALDLLLSETDIDDFTVGSQSHRSFVVKHGIELLEKLLNMEQGDADYAVRKAKGVFADDPELWQTHLHLFSKHSSLLCKYIPLNLPPENYQNIIESLLRDKSIQAFKDSLIKWAKLINHKDLLVKCLANPLMASGQLDWEESLIIIYLEVGEPGKACDCLFRLGHLERALALIEREKFYDRLLDPSLYSSINPNDMETIIQFLVQQTDKVSIDKVMNLFQNVSPPITFKYLDCMVQERGLDSIKDYHNEYMVLLADFDPKPRLKQFLKLSHHYDLQKAYDACRGRDLTNEVVFLLSRMGNYREALKLILETQPDPQYAIDFAKELDDSDLWADLVEYSLDKPGYITCLLKNNSHVDAIDVIRRIPSGIGCIPELCHTLEGLFQDYHVQYLLRQGALSIFRSDCEAISLKVYSMLRKGTRICRQSVCQICNRSIMDMVSKIDDVVIFRCGHDYHVSCLRTHQYLFPCCSSDSHQLEDGWWCIKCTKEKFISNTKQ